jgi:alkylhydroperoxidase family enzyme
MWRFTPINSGQASEELKEIASQLNLDGIPNFLRLLAKSRVSAEAYLHTEAALADGVLSPHQRAKIALLVAEINGSQYCRALSEHIARVAGLTDADIMLSRTACSDDPKAQAMMHFVQAIVLQRGEVGNDDFTAMRKAGLSESEMIEILANVALNIFTNYFNILAQTDLDRSLCQPGHKAPATFQPMVLSTKSGPNP